MSKRDAPNATPVPLIDLQRQYQPLKDELLAAIEAVCDSSRFILGPECGQLEENVARYCGARFGVGCASGSDALLLALMALGIGPGDEVIVPSYTFFATASTVWLLGARPVWADIEPVHFNLDVERLESLFTPATKAIIPVHLFGQCVDMDAVLQIARRHGVAVIEDAAQAIGAEYHGRRAGSLGDVACFSFYPTKNLAAFGDAGMLTTNDEQLAERLALLRVHGMQPRYYHRVVGINSRLDSIQAAVLNVKLPHLDRWTELRRGHAARYASLFADAGLDGTLTLPCEAPGRRHVWNQYVIRVPDGRRDALREHLSARGVGTEIYYPVALHQQECFRDLGDSSGALPETERATRETLALPCFPELTEAEQATVVAHIAEYFAASPTSSRGVPAPNFLGRNGVRENR